MNPLQLERVTFTGADDTTDPAALAQLAKRYPWIEFAVLCSPSQQGTGRYPSRAWRKRFYGSAVPVSQRALHLCGRSVPAFLDDEDEVCREIDHVNRVQLNFTVDKLGRDHILALPSVMTTWLGDCPSIDFILQFNKSNHVLPELFAGDVPRNVSFLVDSSGGRGIAPTRWPAPLERFPTAYAGGMGPGCMQDALAGIAAVTRCTSIDMESRLRTDDRFDLSKVQAVIEELLMLCKPEKDAFGFPVLTLRS